MQSPLQSLLETCISVAIGFLVALATQVLVFPAFGLTVSLGENLLIGTIFTVISVIRSYAVRRLFNYLHRS